MKRLLVANRGEIARRIFRTAKAMGIDTVAVYSDADAQGLHVGEATVAYALGGSSSAETYLSISKIMAAAVATGADAIHPGYGFLSENAAFAAAVVEAGLIWVGPPAAAIRAVGSKSAAKNLADQLNVPRLPGYQGSDQSVERFTTEAANMGYPLMVKAIAGGGGRGMRWVDSAEQLETALISARSEAIASFGNGDLLIERALRHPRHVEVQVFADAHGHCIHLGERDCSVQRRHQKLIEESPSPAVDDALRAQLCDSAVRIAQAAGYVGAGTVEFLLNGRDFYLMEMNTRLQVEHPVTEAVTRLDLVEWQLRVARGEALPLQQPEVRFSGHAIEARLCAEDDTFMPHAGRVQRFVAAKNLRSDHALFSGANVSPHYDSMLAKLIAHAPTRDAAIDQLHQGLSNTRLLGLPNNRSMLMACLQHAEFRAGQARIDFMSQHASALRASLIETEAHHLALAATAILSHGQPGTLTLPCPFERPMRLQHRSETHDLRIREQAPNLFLVSHNGTEQVLKSGDNACTQEGVTRRADCMLTTEGAWHVQVDGVDFFVTDTSFAPNPSSNSDGKGAALGPLKASFSGKVAAVHAVAGQAVKAGDVLLVIESMKLEHAITAARDACVSQVLVEVGQQVSAQQVLMSFDA
jgi:geranyl-CoA carboxylase alpha subunit